MVRLRAEKVARIANFIPEAQVFGKPEGKLLVVGWGSTYGAITSAVEMLQTRGKSLSSVHLRHLNPFPKNLQSVLSRFEHILVPELNLGQLLFLLRARYLVDAIGFNKVKGLPFTIKELVTRMEEFV